MAMSKYVSGNPVVIDYTPVGAVSAGDVVVRGLLTNIVVADIEAGQLGAVKVFGSIERLATTESFDEMDMAFWNESASKVTSTVTDIYMGRIAKQFSATEVDVIHNLGTEALGS
ncbi:MAG: DUF2190 family protein [Candidatus Omnitrophota bacterium]|jgi:predicted RecA/RadA family phage recombinase